MHTLPFRPHALWNSQSYHKRYLFNFFTRLPAPSLRWLGVLHLLPLMDSRTHAFVDKLNRPPALALFTEWEWERRHSTCCHVLHWVRHPNDSEAVFFKVKQLHNVVLNSCLPHHLDRLLQSQPPAVSHSPPSCFQLHICMLIISRWIIDEDNWRDVYTNVTKRSICLGLIPQVSWA